MATKTAAKAADIVVIGSINMDLVCRTREMPAPGETVLGGDLVTIPGGKVPRFTAGSQLKQAVKG